MISFIALTFFTLSLAAQADAKLACEGHDMAVQVEATDVSATTFMQIGGRAIPSLRECKGWAHGNHRMGAKWRCPHGEAGSDIRYEVYPIFTPPSGKPPFVRVLQWDGNKPEALDLKDCE